MQKNIELRNDRKRQQEFLKAMRAMTKAFDEKKIPLTAAFEVCLSLAVKIAADNGVPIEVFLADCKSTWLNHEHSNLMLADKTPNLT